MTPFQRARFLGERDQSIMELLSEKDRKFLDNVKNANDQKGQQQKSSVTIEFFEEEPMKAHRFKKYVQYLKRGIKIK